MRPPDRRDPPRPGLPGLPSHPDDAAPSPPAAPSSFDVGFAAPAGLEHDFSPVYQPASHRRGDERRAARAANEPDEPDEPADWIRPWPAKLHRWPLILLRRFGAWLAALPAYLVLAFATLARPLLWPAALALVVYIYWKLPSGVAAAWPIYALAAAPSLLVATANVVGRWYQRPTPSVFARSAAEWLIDRARLFPDLGLTIAELERGNRRNFYHPTSRTIVLSDRVRDEHTARAYAIAAHELGHALVHAWAPRLGAASTWCRGYTTMAFRFASLLLLGIALTGAAAWLPLAWSLFLLAAATQALILFDEAAASWLAMRELRLISVEAEPRRAARRYLLAAFSTYGGRALAFALPLFTWTLWSGFFGDGLLHPAPLLTGLSAALAALTAPLVIVGCSLVLAVLLIPRGLDVSSASLRRASIALMIAGLLSTPLFTILVAAQPLTLAAPWTLLLALVPTTLVLAAPLQLLISLVVMRLPDFDLPDAPLPRTTWQIHQTSLAKLLAPKERGVSPVHALLLATPLPLALLHLLHWLHLV